MAITSATKVDPSSGIDCREIDAQVERLLQHPLFHQSKRLPGFLLYIVSEALRHGSEGSVKERTLGIEVFGRKPDYDNNSDPVVRVTATELRKKLAQYYYEDAHAGELRIELPPGAYLPHFRKVAVAEAVSIEPVASIDSAESSDLLNPIDEAEPLASHPQETEQTRTSAITWLKISASLVLFLIAVGALGFGYVWHRSHTPLDLFWSQFENNSSRVLVVMPVIGSDIVQGPDTPSRTISVLPNLSLEDTNLAVRITGQMERHEIHYLLASAPEVSYEELRSGPAVLIGALDNVWTMRLAQNLPFAFEKTTDHHSARIFDRTSGGKSWSVDITTPHTRIVRDYGIIARYNDRVTGQPALIVAGITSQGTQAAGELLTSATYSYLEPIASKASNFEVIVETDAIDGHAGPPQVVASKTW